MSDSSPADIAALKAEVAALRATLALLISGLHGRNNYGSLDDWRDGAMQRLAAELTGQTGNPHFVAAFEQLRAAVLSFPSKEPRGD